MIVACSVLAAIAFAAVASAKTVQDPNDTAGKIDVKSATFSKTKSGKFKFVVTFFEAVPAKGDVGNEYLNIWKTKPHVQKGCGGCFKEGPYVMQGPQTGKDRPVFTGGEAGTPYKQTGKGRIKRDGSKLTFILPPKAVGSPTDKFFWRIRTDYYGPESQCPGGPCEDHAPDGSKVVKETL
jgi:hypothetical protein